MFGEPTRDMIMPNVDLFATLNSTPILVAREALTRVFEECPYDWDEISPWIGESGASTWDDRKPNSTPWTCPLCAHPMRWIYWENNTLPEALCNRGGYVEICETCGWWGRFELVWMS